MAVNWKLHAGALAALTAVISVAYVLTAPPPPPPVDPNLTGDRAIEIYSATWGLECNPLIQAAIDQQKNSPLPLDENGKPKPLIKYELAKKDNVIVSVGEICNGKNSCSITATDRNLGTESFSSCAKKLEISYRCYSYDRLWNLSVSYGATKKIDCNAAPSTPSK